MGDEKLPPNWREGFDLHMAHLHHGEPHTHRDCPMLIDVLAEVERLRARNEALEKVAKHVAEWARGRARLEDEADEQGGEEHHAIARKLDAALENTDA